LSPNGKQNDQLSSVKGVWADHSPTVAMRVKRMTPSSPILIEQPPQAKSGRQFIRKWWNYGICLNR